MSHPEIRLAWFDRRTGRPIRVSRPLDAVKKLFMLPPPGTRLWKYGDYGKFAQLFSDRTLYFRRADKLPDMYEGKFTKANKGRRSEMFAAAFEDLKLGDPAKIHSIQESQRSRTFLHCWHKNDRENPRMWKEYTTTPNSIVLVSNLEAVFAGTSNACEGAEVHYIGEDEPLPELHSLAALVHKRREPYAFEDEFRLIYILPAGESIHEDYPDDYYRLIKADPAKLLCEVRFHPNATQQFKARVKADIIAAGVSIPSRDSDFTAR